MSGPSQIARLSIPAAAVALLTGCAAKKVDPPSPATSTMTYARSSATSFDPPPPPAIPYENVITRGDYRVTLLSVGRRTVLERAEADDKHGYPPNLRGRSVAVVVFDVEHLVERLDAPAGAKGFTGSTPELAFDGVRDTARRVGYRVTKGLIVPADSIGWIVFDAKTPLAPGATYERHRFVGVPAGAKTVTIRVFPDPQDQREGVVFADVPIVEPPPAGE